MLNNLYQSLDPVAFTIGPFSARWYGPCLCGGLHLRHCHHVCSWQALEDALRLRLALHHYAMRHDRCYRGRSPGLRAFYNWDMYAANPLAILEFSRGGMSFHGGFIGALVAGIVAARMVRMPYLSLVDLAIIGVPIGLFLWSLCKFRQRRTVGRANRSSLGRCVWRFCWHGATPSQPAVRGLCWKAHCCLRSSS